MIEDVPTHTYVGLKFANNFRWNHHIHEVTQKARKHLNLMIPLKFNVDRKTLETMYNAFVLPTMEYGNVI